MTINDFVKEIKDIFGNDIQFKATSNKGVVYKTEGYDERNTTDNERKKRSNNICSW